MAKTTVTLRCLWDNGKTQKLPGQTLSMEIAQAEKLAGMGLVELHSGGIPKGKVTSPAPKPAAASQSDADDDLHIPDPDDLLGIQDEETE